MGKHANHLSKTQPDRGYIPHHGGPVVGDGNHRSRLGRVAGVIFRLPNGKPALTPKGGAK